MPDGFFFGKPLCAVLSQFSFCIWEDHQEMCFLISSVTSCLCELLTGVKSIWSKSHIVLPLSKVFVGLMWFLCLGFWVFVPVCSGFGVSA